MSADTGMASQLLWSTPKEQPHFNDHYKDLLDQLPPSIKKEVWLRLTTRKNNPLSNEQVSGIHPEINTLLTKEVNRYYKKKIARNSRLKQILPLMVPVPYPDWMGLRSS